MTIALPYHCKDCGRNFRLYETERKMCFFCQSINIAIKNPIMWWDKNETSRYP